jgi:hypothetical protein
MTPDSAIDGAPDPDSLNKDQAFKQILVLIRMHLPGFYLLINKNLHNFHLENFGVNIMVATIAFLNLDPNIEYETHFLHADVMKNSKSVLLASSF